MLSSLLIAIALLQSPQAVEPCGDKRVTSGAEAYVVADPGRAADTLVTAVVCLKVGRGVKVGSYHGELTFDSTSARVVDVARATGGMRVENAKDGGRVRFAGADPMGFADGMLLRVTFRPTRRGKAPALTLQMRELNSTAGASLLVAKGKPR